MLALRKLELLLQAAILPKIAADNVLLYSCRLLLNKLGDYIAEHRGYSVETLVCGADEVQRIIIQENLLDNEDGDSLAELRARLHASKA